MCAVHMACHQIKNELHCITGTHSTAHTQNSSRVPATVSRELTVPQCFVVTASFPQHPWRCCHRCHRGKRTSAFQTTLLQHTHTCTVHTDQNEIARQMANACLCQMLFSNGVDICKIEYFRRFRSVGLL